MSGKIEARLQELGIEIPEAAAPVANYVAYVVTGKLGENMDAEAGAAAARACAISLLAQVKAACGGDLDRVVRCVRLGGFVNSTADFTDQPEVINGASNLMVEVFGDAGKHARSAVSAASLPVGVAVEVECVAELA